jgi:hypothetical protein
MRKVICSMASGPHSVLLALSRTTFEAYAAAHAFDIVIRSPDQVPDVPNGDLDAPEPKKSLGWYRERGAQLVRWATIRMPVSRKFRRFAPSGSRRARALDGLADNALRVLTWTLRASTPASWRKLDLIRELMREYDVVVWIDADAVFVVPGVDITEELVPGKWLYAVEHTTHEGTHINAGVLMVRSCAESHAFFRDVAKRKHYMLHNWWEQAAMLYMLGYDLWPLGRSRVTKYTHGLAVLDKRWNSIPSDPSESPRVIHYAGVGNNRRLELLRERVAAPKEG